MPRRSAADLAVVPAVPVPRPPAPPHLVPEEAAMWRETVEGLPPHWFPGASLVLLEVYCGAVVGMRESKAIMDAEASSTSAYRDAARLYTAQTAMVLRLAKVLRLGPRHDRTKPRAVPLGPRPWDMMPSYRGDDDDRGFERELKEVEAEYAKKKAKQPAPDDLSVA